MKPLHLILGLFLLMRSLALLNAQDPNDIYSFSLQKVNDEYFVSQPKLLTGYNINAYNSQPNFVDSKNLMVTSQLKGTSQTDIYGLNIYTRQMHQITDTPEAEYSPQLHPDNKSFNCVRVESDGKTQRLWNFPLDHSSQGQPLFPDTKNVGYYHWLNKSQVAMFLVGEPHSLIIGDTKDNTQEPITSNIGRGMGTAPNGDLLYIQKLSERTWYIKQLDIKTKKSFIVTETLDGAEDFAVMSDGAILMAKDSQLFLYDVKNSKQWKMIADFAIYGLTKINRLAFNGDRILVLVNEE